MGDTNAVTVLELAHRRQLINANVLSPETLLLPERPLPDGPEFGDVYIDDLVLFSMLHMSRLHHLQSCPRAARAERMYRQLAMPISSDKVVSELNSGAVHWTGSLVLWGSPRHSAGSPLGRNAWFTPTNPGCVELRAQFPEGSALLFRRRIHVCQKIAHTATHSRPRCALG